MTRLTSKIAAILMNSKALSVHSKAYIPVVMSYVKYEASQDGADAAPLIILHGLIGAKENWSVLGKGLRDNTKPQRTIIAADVRNHGDSPHADKHCYRHIVEDIKLLMFKLNIQKVALMGHSMGGRGVMYFSLIYPDLVDKLIVVDVSPVNHPQVSEFNAIIELLSHMQKVNFPSDASKAETRQNLDKQLEEHISTQALRSFLLANLDEKPNGSFGWRLNLDVLIENFMDNVRLFPPVTNMHFNGSTLFVTGAKSNFVPNKDHKEILKLFPRARFVEIPDAGHWVHHEKPKQVLEVCSNFLNGTD